MRRVFVTVVHHAMVCNHCLHATTHCFECKKPFIDFQDVLCDPDFDKHTCKGCCKGKPSGRIPTIEPEDSESPLECLQKLPAERPKIGGRRG